MRFRERIVNHALKYGVTKAAIRYKTNRMFIYRQLEKYDGTVQSLALKSKRPKTHPNMHTKEELELIKKTNSRFARDGRAEVYVKLREKGYKRSFGSMCRQIRLMKLKEAKVKRHYKSDTKYEVIRAKFPGDRVQVDIKYVPSYCIGFNSHGKRYYQITAIDEYSRKRILKIVDEKSVNHTSDFVEELEEKFGFRIKTIQTDNGSEFVNNSELSEKLTLFEKTLKKLGIEHVRTRPYSPWQNGIVERSHRIDNGFYDRAYFKSEEDMRKKLSRYQNRYNNIHRQVLNFNSPNKMVNEYELRH